MNNLPPSDSLPHGLQYVESARWASYFGDIIFVLNATGVVVAAQINDSALASLVGDTWLDENLMDIVAEESRETVSGLLMFDTNQVEDDEDGAVWESVTIGLPDGEQLPLDLGVLVHESDGNHLVIARDMRTIASLRQQLLNAQLTVEQDYWRLRMVETRYRSLFQMTSEGLLVVDNSSGRVMESNLAANNLLLGEGDKLVGKKLSAGFKSSSATKVEALLDSARTNGHSDLAGLASSNADKQLSLSATMLQQGEELRVLVHVVAQTNTADDATQPRHGLTPVLEPSLQDAPDAALLTDAEGAVVSVNAAFLALTEMQKADQAMGKHISNWIGKTSVESNVLMTNLKRHGSIKLFVTEVRGALDSTSEVEISASRTRQNNASYFVFLIRDVSRRLSRELDGNDKLPSSVAEITDRVGRIPLKDLVKQSTSVIEKLCIESALQITDNNRASAAELLGLSRQSLYAKLREYGLGKPSK